MLQQVPTSQVEGFADETQQAAVAFVEAAVKALLVPQQEAQSTQLEQLQLTKSLAQAASQLEQAQACSNLAESLQVA